MQTILIFLIVIIVLVVIHELGHFFVAKAFGIRVDEFGIGYPPRAKKMFVWKETLFTLNWLPFGGFVKIFGEEGAVPESHSFSSQKLWKRVCVVLAGVFANMVLAGVLYCISFSIGFMAPAGSFSSSFNYSPNETIITAVSKGSPASEAHFAIGDSITQMSAGRDVVTPENVTDVVSFIKKHPNESVIFSIVRNKKGQELAVVPKSETVDVAPSIGVSLAEVSHVRLPFLQSIGVGFKYAIIEFASILHSLKLMVLELFGSDSHILGQVSGPVGIATIAKEAYSLGVGSFLAFVALISVNLAVINLFPFPALDGGRCILEFFSRNGKSRIPNKIIGGVNQVSFLLLLLLMLVVTYHDIVKLF